MKIIYIYLIVMYKENSILDIKNVFLWKKWKQRWHPKVLSIATFGLEQTEDPDQTAMEQSDQGLHCNPSASFGCITIWTASSKFGTYCLCKQRRFRRACASVQSRQNIRWLLIQAVNQEEPSDRKPDPWPLWMAGHAQLKFVMTECSKTKIRLMGPIWIIKVIISSVQFFLIFIVSCGIKYRKYNLAGKSEWELEKTEEQIRRVSGDN